MLWTFPTTIWYIRLLSYFVILSCLIYLLSHTLFWKINKKQNLKIPINHKTLHTQCILYLDKEKWNMKIWIAINNPPKTNFDVPIPTNFLSLRDQRAYKFSSTCTTITTTSKTIFRKTNKGFCTTYTYYYSSWLDRNTTSLICLCAKYIKSWI